MTTLRQNLREQLLHVPLGPAVGGGRLEMVYRVLSGAWRVRHCGHIDLTSPQSRSFFEWVGAHTDQQLHRRDSVLVEWEPFTHLQDSVLGATIGIIEKHGIDQVSMPAIARAAGISLDALHSTFGTLPELIAAQREYLQEQVHQGDVETSTPTARTVLREEVARFFDHQIALARSWSLTHQGLSQKRARELVNTPLYAEILTAQQLDPAALAAAYFIDAHRTPDPDEPLIPVPLDLRDLMLRALD